MHVKARPAQERFWEKVNKTDNCWLWTAYINPDGYGELHYGRRNDFVLAHRFSWQLHHGPIAPGLFVDHDCQNNHCVRPDHLRIVSNPNWLRESIETRFWKHVEKTDGCWMWIGSKSEKGYGKIQRYFDNGYRRPDRAHRVSWELHKGPIPDGLWVLHRCDNPSCVRPDHLFLGTAHDNMQDMVKKNRQRGPACRYRS